MRGMKDSGVPWIGDIAEECFVVRLKHGTYMKGRIGWQGLKSQDFIDDGPFCITSTDFQNGKVVWERCYHVSEERYEMDPYIQVKEGDILISKDGTIGKLALIDKLPDKACLNSHLLIIRPSKRYTTKYLFYVLSSDVFVHYYSLVGSGSTMQSLSQEKLGEFSFPIWSIQKQERIADFLDSKCSEIDALSADIQSEIDTLEAYKRSVITEAVTKGLDKNVPMKDSGVEWIGEIPEGWKISRLKYLTVCRDSERIPVDKNQRNDGLYPYWGAGSIMDYIDKYIFDDDLVLLGEDGAPFFDNRRDVAHHIEGKCWINNHIHVLQAKSGIMINSFLTYFLNIVDYKSYINGSILNKLTQGNMNEISI